MLKLVGILPIRTPLNMLETQGRQQYPGIAEGDYRKCLFRSVSKNPFG